MSRGGMCSNAFGGRTRLDQLQLIDLMVGNTSPEKILYLETIADAAQNYLYFGLGKNGTTPDEFIWSWQYFFQVRADLPSTWEQARVMCLSAGPGMTPDLTLVLTDEQLQNECFDTHYVSSGLDQHMTMERFIRWIKEVRLDVVEENLAQVTDYIGALQTQEFDQVAPGWQLPLRAMDFVHTLVNPNAALDLAQMLYYPDFMHSPPRSRSHCEDTDPQDRRHCYHGPDTGHRVPMVPSYTGQVTLQIQADTRRRGQISMRRPIRTDGQMMLVVPGETTEADPPTPTAPPGPSAPKHNKNREPQTLTHSDQPSVGLHKKGKFLITKPNDVYAADVLRELRERSRFYVTRDLDFYVGGSSELKSHLSLDAKLELYTLLGKKLEDHPDFLALLSYGVDIQVSPSLSNWMKKEEKRQKLENTPFPRTASVDSDVSLYDRCCEGAILRCIKDYVPEGGGSRIFQEGKRYIVLECGGEGKDSVVLSTHPVESRAVVEAAGTGARHQWTSFDAPMEQWFDDSEETDVGPSIEELYPERVAEMRKRLKDMGLELYEHVQLDAALEALMRGVVNAKPMRMGKSSEAIAVALLWGSKKVAIISPRNARIHWVKEFQRLKVPGYVVVNKLDDLEKPGKFYLLTYTWLRRNEDQTADGRKNHTNYLHPSTKTRRVKKASAFSSKEYETVTDNLVNPCPHCGQVMERRVPATTDEGDVIVGEDGRPLEWEWTDHRGYICRNKDCEWTDDTRNAKGAAWQNKRSLVHHKGGYVDVMLAAHSQCPERVHGRRCPHCGATDGVWIPGLYKRLKKRFTCIIPDEIHSIKDRTSEQGKATSNLRARRRMGLTGTLISNGPLDVYQPLHWSLNAPTSGFPYRRAEGEKDFDKRFCDKIYLQRPAGVDEHGNEITKTVAKQVPFLKTPPDFWRFMAPKIIRRTYLDPLWLKSLTEAGRMLPHVEVKKLPTEMHSEQAQIMLKCIQDFRGTFEKMQAESSKKGQLVNPTLVISQMTMMKIVATCPEMLNERFGTEVYKGPKGGGKTFHIVDLVKEKIGQGGKVLVISDYVAMQRSMEEALAYYKPIRFLTSWDDEARKDAFDLFQEDPERKVFVAGTRAIKEGVDLSAADTCICTDLLWSPAFQVQAWSRILAPQTRERNCEIYLATRNRSLDEHIFNVFYSKMVAAEQALDRKVLSRRAQIVDIKWFVDRVLEEEEAIAGYLRDAGEPTVLPELDFTQLQERAV